MRTIEISANKSRADQAQKIIDLLWSQAALTDDETASLLSTLIEANANLLLAVCLHKDLSQEEFQDLCDTFCRGIGGAINSISDSLAQGSEYDA